MSEEEEKELYADDVHPWASTKGGNRGICRISPFNFVHILPIIIVYNMINNEWVWISFFTVIYTDYSGQDNLKNVKLMKH